MLSWARGEIIKDSDGKIVTPEAHADDTTVPRFTLVLRIAPSRVCAERIFERLVCVYARTRTRLFELRIRALCSSSGKTLLVGRQWEELSNADICSNVPRRRGGYRRVPSRLRRMFLTCKYSIFNLFGIFIYRSESELTGNRFEKRCATDIIRGPRGRSKRERGSRAEWTSDPEDENRALSRRIH